MAFFSSFSTSGFSRFVPFIQSKILVIRSRIKGIGIRFPTIQMGIASHMGTSRNAGPAVRSPPLNSRIGTMEMRNMIISFPTFPPKFSINQLISASFIF